MYLWQFLILAVLLVGALVTVSAYARTLSRTIGHANARLKRIEEALVVANDRLLKRTEPAATEPTPAISGNDRASYLTIQDLKGDARRAQSQATYSGSRRNSAAAPNSSSPMNSIHGRMNPSETTVEQVESVATSTARETFEKSDAQASTDSACSLNADSASAILEEGDRLETMGEPPAVGSSAEAQADSPSSNAAEDAGEPDSELSNRSAAHDAIARQNNNELLILSNQRRRRRARLGH